MQDSRGKDCLLQEEKKLNGTTFTVRKIELDAGEIVGCSLMIYILSLDPSGVISLLYPPRNARESLAPNTKLSTNLGNPCYTYALEADAPLGLETIKIIASENPIDADLLTQSGIKGNERSGNSPLERLLVQAGANTRGPRPFRRSVADWAAINVDYVVVP